MAKRKLKMTPSAKAARRRYRERTLKHNLRKMKRKKPHAPKRRRTKVYAVAPGNWHSKHKCHRRRCGRQATHFVGIKRRKKCCDLHLPKGPKKFMRFDHRKNKWQPIIFLG